MTSNFKISIFIGFVILSFNCFGQSKDSVLKDIKTWYKSINDDSSLKVIKLENDEVTEENTDGGIELKGYFKDKELVKIQLSVGLSNCLQQFGYYFKNGKLFFIYETEDDYPSNKDGTLNYNKLANAFQGRFYFQNNLIIDKIVKGSKRSGTPSIDIKETLNDLKTYKQLLIKKFNKGK